MCVCDRVIVLMLQLQCPKAVSVDAGLRPTNVVCVSFVCFIIDDCCSFFQLIS